ncbi:MAG: dihydroxy-acid dehydratase [Clostridiales bacterium]|jgi:dihydroxy-acid dehydratase|nr:dihydroxy-acid dehydratase [Clostridiales bacterium]
MILTEGPESAPNRALLKCIGIDDLKKPLIGIISPYNEMLPSAAALKALEETARNGIRLAGATPALIPVASVCGDLASEFTGGYNLLQRELIADSVELCANVNKLDGMILLFNDGNTAAGLLLGAVRVNIPSLFISPGINAPSEYEGGAVYLNTVREAVSLLKNGRMSDTELGEIENSLPSETGASPSQDDNTLPIVIEALGLSFPDNSRFNISTFKKQDMIKQAVKALVKALKDQILPRKVLSVHSFYNALTVGLSVGGSTNDILNLIALASECGFDLSYKLLSELSAKTPVIAPFGAVYDVIKDGGASALLSALANKSLINTAALTFSGKTIDERIKAYRAQAPAASAVIDTAKTQTNAVLVLKNNLTDDECLVRKAAVPEEMYQHSGLARVYDNEEDAVSGLYSGYINPGDVIVIRYEGPKGSPGMREINKACAALKGLGLTKTNPIITDGRVNNAAEGLILAHMSDEAYVGGVLAYLKDGDKITIDLTKGKLNFDVKDFKIRQKRIITRNDKQYGAMERYRSQVTQSKNGAILSVKPITKNIDY